MICVHDHGCLSQLHDFDHRDCNCNAGKLAAIKAQFPLCRTCKGTEKGAEGISGDGKKAWAHCPDCKDGKTTIEQLVQRWNTYERDSERMNELLEELEAENERLREVKPS